MARERKADDIQMSVAGFELLRAGKHRQGLALIKRASGLSPGVPNSVGLGVAYLIAEDY